MSGYDVTQKDSVSLRTVRHLGRVSQWRPARQGVFTSVFWGVDVTNSILTPTSRNDLASPQRNPLQAVRLQPVVVCSATQKPDFISRHRKLSLSVANVVLRRFPGSTGGHVIQGLNKQMTSSSGDSRACVKGFSRRRGQRPKS